MEQQKTKWWKNITKQMVVIWAVSFVGLMVVVFGSISLGLGVSRISYGPHHMIAHNNIFYIEYMNEHHRKELIRSTGEPLHEEPINGIMNHLRDGSRTNRLSDLFRGNPDRYSVENNNTNTLYLNTFRSTYANNAIIIWLVRPQHAVATTSRTQFALTTNTEDNRDTQVHAIVIPLDRTQDRFQEQTWFLLTRDPNRHATSGALIMANKITTHGNYHALGKYVNDLFVRL